MLICTVQQAFALAAERLCAGQLQEAEALYRHILSVQPNHAEALHLLGVTAHRTGRNDLAIESIQKALALNPDNPGACSNLGEAYRAKGQLNDAVAAYRRALALKPDLVPTHCNLGNVFMQQGQLNGAITAYRRALALQPNQSDTLNSLGVALISTGELDEAIAAFRRASTLKPGCVEAHNNLGNALREKGCLDEAVVAFRCALSLKPDYAEAHSNLGNALKDHGRCGEAIAEYRCALRCEPQNPILHSNLVNMLLFDTQEGQKAVPEECQSWSYQFARPLKRFIQPHTNHCDPNRRLRVGYVSPYFQDHVVGRNLLPLLRYHDRQNFEIVCHSGVMRADRLTEKFRQTAQQWHRTVGVGDEALAEMIRAEEIDILIDLTQHLAENRLPVFARQPAPVQVSFAGYPESTGLETIGYRISDRWSEQDGVPNAEGLLVKANGYEQVYLIDTFWCYDPCGVDVPVNPLPAQAGEVISFGSLNNFCKVNDPLLTLWARVLNSVKDSRLIILSHEGSHRERTLRFLDAEGIEPHRVEFVTPRPRKEYLELYHRLDIVLDTFPYNGHTTSLDALWMGVPVVSLCGERPVSRAGLSQLSNLGLPELVAFTEDQYVEIAAKLANDLPRLKELRATLRERMEKSVLMDGPHFARQIEACYRSMWRQWCASQTA